MNYKSIFEFETILFIYKNFITKNYQLLKSLALLCVGPLLKLQWDQASPFNLFSPFHPVLGKTFPAGCAAVATAQVMKYNRHPALVNSPNNHHFNWDNMPNNVDTLYSPPYSNYSTPYLINHVAEAVNMKFTTIGSDMLSWAFPWDLENGIRSYGYTVTRTSHSDANVIAQICTYNRPVIMGGGTINLPNPLSYTGNGHYWVCDGYSNVSKSITYFMEFIDTNTCTYYSHPYIYNTSNPFTSSQYCYIRFSMNWGWGGTHNGWFFDVNSGNGNFQYG